MDCDYFTFQSHPYKYGHEVADPLLLQKAKFSYRLLSEVGLPRRATIIMALPSLILIIPWLFYVIFKYDVFIFGFGKSLFPKNLDLPILKVLGKRVISVLSHGSEARPPFIDGYHQSTDGKKVTISDLVKLTSVTRKKVQFYDKYASLVVGNPFSNSQFNTQRFINTFALGVPIDLTAFSILFEKNIPKEQKQGSGKVMILHCPGHPVAKGSRQIKASIDRLNGKGYDIELVVVQNETNAEVISEITKCDFAIDQIFTDFPIVAFATESAWFGKPAVVGGYRLAEQKIHAPKGMWPPIQVCTLETLDNAIKDLVINLSKRKKLGLSAKNFVSERA